MTTNPLILRGSLRRTLTLGLRKRPSDERVLGMMASVGLSNDLFDLDLVLLAGGTELKPAEAGAHRSCECAFEQPRRSTHRRSDVIPFE